MKKVIFVLIGLFLCMNVVAIPVSVTASENISSDVEEVEEEKEMGLLDDLYYRFFEKDTKDFLDYVLLAILIMGLLIVMVFQNTHYYETVHVQEPKTIEVIEPKTSEIIEPKIVEVAESIEEDKISYQEETVVEKPKRERKKKSQ